MGSRPTGGAAILAVLAVSAVLTGAPRSIAGQPSVAFIPASDCADAIICAGLVELRQEGSRGDA